MAATGRRSPKLRPEGHFEPKNGLKNGLEWPFFRFSSYLMPLPQRPRRYCKGTRHSEAEPTEWRTICRQRFHDVSSRRAKRAEVLRRNLFECARKNFEKHFKIFSSTVLFFFGLVFCAHLFRIRLQSLGTPPAIAGRVPHSFRLPRKIC